MEASEIEALVRRDREQWDALVAKLDANPEAVLHDPQSPAWTAGDVYMHLCRWMTRSTDELEAYLRDGTRMDPIPGTDDEINARWQAEDSALSFGDARARGHAAFDRRASVLEGIPVERWDILVAAFARADGWEHISAHHRYVVE